MLNMTPYILLLPLLGFLVLGLAGRALPRPLISLIGCGTIFAAFVLAGVDFASLLATPAAARLHDTQLWHWTVSGTLTIPFGLLARPALGRHAADRDWCRLPDPRLLHRLHGG